jgi:hypothetical protein
MSADTILIYDLVLGIGVMIVVELLLSESPDSSTP